MLTQFFISEEGGDLHFLSWEAADSERKGFCSYKNRPFSPLFLVLLHGPQMFLVKRYFRVAGEESLLPRQQEGTTGWEDRGGEGPYQGARTRV